MIFFQKEFLSFFSDLRANNNRDWFQTNKKRYEKEVKEPFKAFVGHMLLKMREIDPSVLIAPKDAIFRIYRDIRFSNDKTPYKEHVSAILSSGGRKDMATPGIYLQLNDQEARIYSGIYQPEKAQLEEIRYRIAADLDGFKSLYTTPAFKDLFGEVRGDKNKRLPKELKEASEKEPLIFNKGFYYFHILPANVILKDDFDDLIMRHLEVATPLNNFLTNK